jgi:hypothetical protein
MVAMPFLLLVGTQAVRAQTSDEGGVSFDGGGQEILQSIVVPAIPNAPFSLTLAAEWSRPMSNGGTFTTANSRPIKRDSRGRLYEERWLMTPKGSGVPSQPSWIQIADPQARTLYQCNVRTKVCDLLKLSSSVSARFDPTRVPSGPLQGGKGTRTHEDLGGGYFAGVQVHEYKDTLTVNAGVMGNDLPMSTVRDYRFSPELGINLISTVEAPQIGRQTFTVTELSTTEPDPAYFQPPEGYKIVDHRTPAAKTADAPGR